MGMSSARHRMQAEYRDLMIAWMRTTERWNDPVSKAFESRRLEPIEAKLRTMASAMEKAELQLARARRECGDD